MFVETKAIDSSCSPGVRCDVVWDPADQARGGRVDARDQEAQRGVLGGVGVGDEEYAESDQCQTGRTDGREASPSVSVGNIG